MEFKKSYSLLSFQQKVDSESAQSQRLESGEGGGAQLHPTPLKKYM